MSLPLIREYTRKEHLYEDLTSSSFWVFSDDLTKEYHAFLDLLQISNEDGEAYLEEIDRKRAYYLKGNTPVEQLFRFDKKEKAECGNKTWKFVDPIDKVALKTHWTLFDWLERSIDTRYTHVEMYRTNRFGETFLRLEGDEIHHKGKGGGLVIIRKRNGIEQRTTIHAADKEDVDILFSYFRQKYSASIVQSKKKLREFIKEGFIFKEKPAKMVRDGFTLEKKPSKMKAKWGELKFSGPKNIELSLSVNGQRLDRDKPKQSIIYDLADYKLDPVERKPDPHTIFLITFGICLTKESKKQGRFRDYLPGKKSHGKKYLWFRSAEVRDQWLKIARILHN